jgi:hypothetical protein
VWFSLKKTTKSPVASVYTNCETAVARVSGSFYNARYARNPIQQRSKPG